MRILRFIIVYNLVQNEKKLVSQEFENVRISQYNVVFQYFYLRKGDVLFYVVPALHRRRLFDRLFDLPYATFRVFTSGASIPLHRFLYLENCSTVALAKCAV